MAKNDSNLAGLSIGRFLYDIRSIDLSNQSLAAEFAQEFATKYSRDHSLSEDDTNFLSATLIDVSLFMHYQHEK